MTAALSTPTPEVSPQTLARLGLTQRELTDLIDALAFARGKGNTRLKVPHLTMATVQGINTQAMTLSLTLEDTVQPENANLLTGVPWFGHLFAPGGGGHNVVGDKVWLLKQGDDQFVLGRVRDQFWDTELGVDSITASAQTTATTEQTNNMGLSVPVIVPGTMRIRIEWCCRGIADVGAAASTVIIALFEDGTRIKDTHARPDSTAPCPVASIITHRRPSAGSHSYSIGMWTAIGSGTIEMSATSTSPTELMISRA